MNFVDSHCHLQFDKLSLDLEAVLGRARAAGATKMVCVGTSLTDSHQAIEFAQKYEGVWAAIGVHPHEAKNFLGDKDRQARMAELLVAPRVMAVGEIGLDYYKSQTSKADQQTALREQIELSLPTGLPFIFHVRDAWADFWQIFDEYDNLTGVVHSFSSGTKQLNAALKRGLYVGLNGIMTFTKDHAQLEAAKQVPLDKLLLETDAPFLTPAPKRDEVCEPRHTAVTAEFLARLRNEPIEKIAKATTENTERLFNLS